MRVLFWTVLDAIPLPKPVNGWVKKRLAGALWDAA